MSDFQAVATRTLPRGAARVGEARASRVDPAWLAVGAICAALAGFFVVASFMWPPHEDEALALFVGDRSLGSVFHTVLRERGGAPLHFLVAWAIVHAGGRLEALRLASAACAVASVPVMYAAAGNCHVYVHEDADREMARRIAFNAKVQRPGVCNAAETLLVNAAVAEEVLPVVLADLAEAGVEVVGDERARRAAGDVLVGEASEADWDTEYLGMKMAVGVVDSLQEAIDHVNRHGTGHSEAIVTSSDEASRAFTEGVDAAAVYVNASTRFTDGFEFGMGAEIGNSTQKLHARGPIGLRELTTFKYVIHGEGQVRS
jgi:acyl-CoA reductase-like NAD-dependent aldehyde dehydrogenase